jgi:hypothetical protein
MICDATTLKCRSGCRASATCALNTYCDTTTDTCTGGCDGDNSRCGVGQTCVSYEGPVSACDGSYYCCSSEYCEDSTCNGSNYGCAVGGTDSFGDPDSECRLTCSSNANCASGQVCVQFTDDLAEGPNGSFCAKACANDNDCSGTAEDLCTSYQTPCVCDTSSGLCLWGDGDGGVASGDYQCWATTASWGE